MFANLKIARKLLVSFALIVVAFAAAAVFIVGSLADADRATVLARNSKAASVASDALWYGFIGEQNAVRGFVISQSEKLLADVGRQRDEYAAALGELRQVEHEPAM